MTASTHAYCEELDLAQRYEQFILGSFDDPVRPLTLSRSGDDFQRLYEIAQILHECQKSRPSESFGSVPGAWRNCEYAGGLTEVDFTDAATVDCPACKTVTRLARGSFAR